MTAPAEQPARDNRRHELPSPCRHAFSKMVHRVTSHTDEEVDAGQYTREAFCSVWVCEADLEAGKRYVAYYTQRTPHVLGLRERGGV